MMHDILFITDLNFTFTYMIVARVPNTGLHNTNTPKDLGKYALTFS